MLEQLQFGSDGMMEDFIESIYSDKVWGLTKEELSH